MRATRKLTATLAAFGLLHAQAASAAECITEEQVSALVVFAVPMVIEGIQSVCGSRLDKNGFLATQGAALAERYAAVRAENWPMAKEAFLMFADRSANQRASRQPRDESDVLGEAIIAALPDEALQPLIQAAVVEVLRTRIERKQCPDIERVTEALAPLQPADAGKLIGVIAGMADLKDPEVCDHRN